MADEGVMPIIPKAGSIYIHTGNICTWKRLKQKVNQQPNFEEGGESKVVLLSHLFWVKNPH